MAHNTVFMDGDELGLRSEILGRFPSAKITFENDCRGCLYVDVICVDDSAFHRLRHGIMEVVNGYFSLMGRTTVCDVVVRKAIG